MNKLTMNDAIGFLSAVASMAGGVAAIAMVAVVVAGGGFGWVVLAGCIAFPVSVVVVIGACAGIVRLAAWAGRYYVTIK